MQALLLALLGGECHKQTYTNGVKDRHASIKSHTETCMRIHTCTERRTVRAPTDRYVYSLRGCVCARVYHIYTLCFGSCWDLHDGCDRNINTGPCYTILQDFGSCCCCCCYRCCACFACCGLLLLLILLLAVLLCVAVAATAKGRIRCRH